MIHEHFLSELDLISNKEIRSITERLLDGLPEYVVHVPASSSGKYHPAYALGEGGLARHIKSAVRFANHLFVIHEFSSEERDYIIAALLLHDGLKHGASADAGHTVFEHPVLAAKYIRANSGSEYADHVAPLVETHMGQWTKSTYSDMVLRAPNTDAEKFVHMCDYLASRRDITVEEL